MRPEAEAGSLAWGKQWLLTRLDAGLHPLEGLEPEAARRTVEGLEGLEPEPWTAAWGGLAEEFAARAQAAAGRDERRHLWTQAYRAAFLGRYPVPNHPLKERQYERAREYFVEATALEDPPLEVVELPFAGRPGDGDRLRFYLTKPESAPAGPLAVAMVWAGIDTWKEEMHERLGALMRARGLAVLLVDMPGVGESPVLASADAERQWTPILDWIATRADLDATRCAAVGGSYGGYWAMKLAHTHRDRLRCAVNWGGGVHITFTPEWQERSRNASSYLMDLMEARARIFGGRTFEDYVARCRELSLLDQGWLDRPSAPTLLVNGRDDLQNSIDDFYLSLDHGDPKCVRVFDGGHMGEGPVAPTIVDWVARQLGVG
ncbi:MAG TPA: alpha/beta fold hydrolase [Solirubrobacteraceae bacterium]|jgi:pimeloyl-ACP methyl ester carboxylesterase|nr:alpha/beta fold hydrolase [Solirubrobacteraceae bacterium]